MRGSSGQFAAAVARLLRQVNAVHQDKRSAHLLAPDEFIEYAQEDFSLAGSGGRHTEHGLMLLPVRESTASLASI